MRENRDEVFYLDGCGHWCSVEDQNFANLLVRYKPNTKFIRIPTNWSTLNELEK